MGLSQVARIDDRDICDREGSTILHSNEGGPTVFVSLNVRFWISFRSYSYFIIERGGWLLRAELHLFRGDAVN